MKIPAIVIILGIIVLCCGCIQQKEPPVVTEKAVSAEWKADGKVSDGEYSSCMALSSPAKQGYSGGEMTICWRSDQEYLYMALAGSTSGWMAVGFAPLEWMKDADIILGYVEGSKAVVRDEYSTGNYGPHVEDTLLGGRDDILDSGGSSDGTRTVIEFKRRLDTGDRFDAALTPESRVSIIWAMADDRDPAIKHNVAYGEGILPLSGVQNATKAGAAPSPRDVQGMRFIWEEEKTARDLYVSFYKQTNQSIFANLTRSEQNHMDQVRSIMDRYGVSTPALEREALENQTLIQMYTDLLSRGSRSDQDALKAASTFEEISIMDLQKEINATENQEVVAVYQGLLAGSRKHLRSYVSDLKEQGIAYTPKYLSQAEFDEVMGQR
jgi:hypothetical protein